MTYDFTTIMNRHGMDAIAVDMIPFPDAKVEDGYDVIPMWVADMNFPVCPSIQNKVAERLGQPHFGYFMPRDEYYDSIIRWQAKRNHVTDLTKDAIGYENGVLGCLSSALQAFTAPGDAVFLHSPTYIGFTKALKENGREAVTSALRQDEQGVWRMDYEDMDAKIKASHAHFAVFCSPHNPCGRVWEKEEIEQAMEVFRRNDCIVFSDEIWSDLVLDGRCHVPTQSVSADARNRTIAAYAPSKTFNLAGLIGAYHIVYDTYLRDRLRKQSRLSHYNDMNVLSMYALLGAYTPEGEVWVDELREVILENTRYACKELSEIAPEITVSQPEGTYMLYLDCSKWLEKTGQSMDDLIRQGIAVGVIWQDGRPFGMDHTIRMNVALPKARVEEAFRRLRERVFHA